MDERNPASESDDINRTSEEDLVGKSEDSDEDFEDVDEIEEEDEEGVEEE